MTTLAFMAPLHYLMFILSSCAVMNAMLKLQAYCSSRFCGELTIEDIALHFASCKRPLHLETALNSTVMELK